jgi:BMFP domain-containing protein YqiC
VSLGYCRFSRISNAGKAVGAQMAAKGREPLIKEQRTIAELEAQQHCVVDSAQARPAAPDTAAAR